MVRAFGKSPAPLRAAGLLLHLANAWLLLRLLRTLGLGAAAAGAAAALFMVHPAHVETLACVAFHEELWVALGTLLFLEAHLRGRPGAAAAGLAVALLSKETGLMAPAAAVLADASLARPRSRERLSRYALYGAMAAAFCLARFGPLSGARALDLAAHLGPGERLGRALWGLSVAARIFLWPARLALDYPAVPALSLAEGAARAAAGAAVLCALAVLAARGRGGAGLLLAAWPLAFLLPTSNLLPADVLSLRVMAERWLYVPALGACALVAAGAAGRPAVWAGLLALWSALGAMRARDWSDEARLWGREAARRPDSAFAAEGLGKALLARSAHAAALASLDRALELRRRRRDPLLAAYADLSPDDALAWESHSLYNCIGIARMGLGQAEQAEQAFSRAQALAPSDRMALSALSYLAARDGRFEAASRWLALGLRAHPQDDFLGRLGRDVDRRRRPAPVSFAYGG